MRNVSKGILILFCLVGFAVKAQTTSEKLKKEQQRLESNIANTKLLLEKAQSSTQASFNELKLINNQINYREELLRNYDNQIRGAELKIQERQAQIELLSARVSKLKEQYRQLLVYAYKHRNKYGKMMFVFSSKTYYEALKRAKYLEKIQELLKKQFLVIEQHQKLIAEEIAAIQKEKDYKATVIEQKRKERDEIEIDKVKKAELYEEFKQQEASLIAKLRDEERQRADLKAKIDAAIKREIAEAEARRKKAEEEARKKAAASGTPVAETKVVLPETKEVAALSKSFEGNRGKLPWPVEKGTVVEGFGKNPHPTLANVYTNNNGIDISAPKNAQVRAVFEGEVTSILNIPGAGKVVILKHGNYRTVYSNLQNVFVETGAKVSTKQVIGSLVTKEGQSISTAHFEIHQVSGSVVSSLNPSLWIAK